MPGVEGVMGRWLLMMVLILGGGCALTSGASAGGTGEDRPFNEVIWPVGG